MEAPAGAAEHGTFEIVRGLLGTLAIVVACAHSAPPPPPPPPKPVPRTTLAVLPAESDAFPKAAAALSKSLADAHVVGIDDTHVSKVSLEVVQLSIECVDATAACFAAVGKSLGANKLLFAQLAPGAKKALKVSVTLFDVDTSAPAKTAEKTFPNEAAATTGVADLVAEATR
jgi:hypothetical protein